jgi:thioredoxin reductase
MSIGYEINTNVIIVGAGPAGLSAALAALKANITF